MAPELTHGARLDSLFIFDPSLGGREGQEHEKLMFYYPPHVEPGERHNRVGLAETLVRFTQTFSPGRPCSAVHRRDQRQAMVEVEPSLWCVMTVTLPATYVREKEKDRDRDAKQAPTSANFPTVPGTRVIPRPDLLSDDSLRAMVRQMHASFVVFNRPMRWVMEHYSVKVLRDRLEAHMAPLLEGIDVPGGSGLVNALGGIRFLPVDKDTYLLVQCFVNLTENGFPGVRHTIVTHGGLLVWSGVEQGDARALYAHLSGATTSGGGSSSSGSSGSGSSSGTSAAKALGSGWKGFLAGPERLHDDESPINARQVFIERVGSHPAAAGAFAADDSVDDESDDASDDGSENGGDAGKDGDRKTDHEQGGKKPGQGNSAGVRRDSHLAAVSVTAEREEFRLVIYRHARVTVAFLVEPKVAGDTSFYRSLAASIEPAVANLAAVIEGKSGRVGSVTSSANLGSQSSSSSSSGSSDAMATLGSVIGATTGLGSGSGSGSSGGGIGDTYRYLYFNRMNLALKTSIRSNTSHRGGGGSGSGSPFDASATAVTPEAMAVLCDLRSELAAGRARQVVVRTGGEGWIVGQRSHEREFFVMFDNRSANLAEIDEELRRLSANYFGNIFIN